MRYRSTRANRAEAITDLAHRHRMFGPIEDDLNPAVAFVVDSSSISTERT
ncbi:hypothetical protein [Streptomyces sp. NPDC002779]